MNLNGQRTMENISFIVFIYYLHEHRGEQRATTDDLAALLGLLGLL